ncbi:MAG: hypothetical protein JWN77_3335 [Frankiales bacterium]|jgi:hypothetical protein|nr:hypothetical protein [Frankiales bacterium]
MSPIDDELRSMFSSRADVLAPAADPLAGIERRAKRMRRNRVVASIAGTALAVSAAAVAVPALMPESGSRSEVVPATSADPSVAPSPSRNAAFPAAGLDPGAPWGYRGDPALIAGDNVASLQQEWRAVDHPTSTVTPLYGHVYEPSGRTEIVFLASGKGVYTWGLATSGDAGWKFPFHETFEAGATALLAALPGDEVPRLLVVAAPSTGEIGYATSGKAFSSLPMPYPGIAFRGLEGDTSADAVRVLDGDGDESNPVFEGPAPDPGSGGNDGGVPAATTPDNLVPWPTRGAAVDPALWDKALTAFAAGVGAKRDDVEGKVLFVGPDDAGNRFIFGQGWVSGNDAYTIGYSVNAKGEATPFLGPVTDKGVGVLAFVVAAGTGQSTETLVVIPDPAVTKTFYGEAQSEYIEVTGQENLDGVSLIDRRLRVQGDMLKLLAGNQKVFEGKVESLLCGLKGCG